MTASGFDEVARQIPLYRDCLLAVSEEVKEGVFDIHFKRGQPIALWGRKGTVFLASRGQVVRDAAQAKPVSPGQMQELFLQVCGHSIFRHEEEIRKGYVRLGEHCRVGICGTAVLEGTQVRSVRDVTSLVFRIPREVPGCSDRLFQAGVPVERGVLVAGPPSSGKTTFLRDVARSLSLGRGTPRRRVAVLDERGELGGFDLGPCADVLRGYPKAAGLDAAVRMLSPQVVLCDELSPDDLEAVRGALFSGVALVASLHGTEADLARRPLGRALLESGAFQTVVCLTGRETPGKIASICPTDDLLCGKGGGRNAAAGGGAPDFQRASGRDGGGFPAAPPGPIVA